MRLSHALTLALITQTLSTLGAPTLIPYDARNVHHQQEAIALYKSAKGASAEIPMALEHNYEDGILPTASIFVDDNNAIIGLIIYINRKVQGKPVAAINELIMDQHHNKQASDLLSAFEQKKRAEHFVQINADVTPNNKSIFSRAGFKTTRDKGMMAKNIEGKCCIQ